MGGSVMTFACSMNQRTASGPAGPAAFSVSMTRALGMAVRTCAPLLRVHGQDIQLVEAQKENAVLKEIEVHGVERTRYHVSGVVNKLGLDLVEADELLERIVELVPTFREGTLL